MSGSKVMGWTICMNRQTEYTITGFWSLVSHMTAQSSFHPVVQLYRSDEDNMRAQILPPRPHLTLLRNQAATIREVLYQTRPVTASLLPVCPMSLKQLLFRVIAFFTTLTWKCLWPNPSPPPATADPCNYFHISWLNSCLHFPAGPTPHVNFGVVHWLGFSCFHPTTHEKCDLSKPRSTFVSVRTKRIGWKRTPKVKNFSNQNNPNETSTAWRKLSAESLQSSFHAVLLTDQQVCGCHPPEEAHTFCGAIFSYDALHGSYDLLRNGRGHGWGVNCTVRMTAQVIHQILKHQTDIW